MIALGSVVRGLACAAAVSTIGCSGARTKLVAPDARFSVSFTRGLRGADGELVPAERRQVVGKFRESRTAWAIVYSGLNITPTKDLSDAINEQVAAAGGDAIVHLKVGSADCALDWFFPLTFLPVWPGCTNIYIEGDIVRVTPPNEAPARDQTQASVRSAP